MLLNENPRPSNSNPPIREELVFNLVFGLWIQNVAEPRRNGRIGKVLELGDPHFHAAIWNAIAVLERFCRSASEIESATETAF